MKVWYTNSQCGSHLRDWQIIQNSIPNFELVERMWDADVAIIYLCGISQEAISEAEKDIEKVEFALFRNPDFKVFIGGCAAELISVQTLLGKHKLTNVFNKDTMAEVVLSGLGIKPSEEPATFIMCDTATINIATGCRRRCAFCKSWYLDMEYHSVPKDIIMAEIGDAIKRDILHICLTAENSTEYGSEVDGKGHLEELIREIFKTYPNIKIMDIMGVCLDEVDDKLVKYFLKESRINMIQMEVQSFSKEVRSKMLLKKSAEEAKSIYTKLRAKKIIKSNIITGHPGENLANFSSQLNFILAKDELCWSLDISPFDNTPGTHSHKLEQMNRKDYEAVRDVFIDAIEKMRMTWLAELKKSERLLHTYALTYDAASNRTLCMVWGQPVIITVDGHLPLYNNYTIRPTSFSDLVGDDNCIMMAGEVVV